MYYNLFLPFLCKIYRNSVTSCAPKVMSHSSKAVSFFFSLSVFNLSCFSDHIVTCFESFVRSEVLGGWAKKGSFIEKRCSSLHQYLKPIFFKLGVSKDICPSANNFDNNTYNNADVECFII